MYLLRFTEIDDPCIQISHYFFHQTPKQLSKWKDGRKCFKQVVRISGFTIFYKWSSMALFKIQISSQLSFNRRQTFCSTL